jgi:hypothetical protein
LDAAERDWIFRNIIRSFNKLEHLSRIMIATLANLRFERIEYRIRDFRVYGSRFKKGRDVIGHR